MFNRKRLFSNSAFAVAFVTMLALHCTLPEDPNDPSNTSVNIILRASKWKVENSFLEDTAGNPIQIGAALHLRENIESVNLKIAFGGTVVFDTTYTNLLTASSDTLWKEIVFYSEGSRTVTLTPKSKLGLSSVSATIQIIGKEFPVNHAPTINVGGIMVVKPTETCSLTIKTADPDAGQILNVFMTGNPTGSQLQKNNSQFIWTAPVGFIGNDTVVFTVIDNGMPPQSAAATVILTVTATPHPPKIEVTGDRSLSPLETCSLFVKVSDEDSGQVLKRSMSGGPEGSQFLNDSIFVWVVPEDFIGEKIVTFTVTDNGVPPLSSSVLDTITVSLISVNTAPKWTVERLPVPLKDTAKYTKKLMDICRDNDGDAITFTLAAGTPVGDTIIGTTYSFLAKPTLIGQYSVRIIASDPKGAADTLIIDMTVSSSAAVDTTPPTINLVAPPKDSQIVSTPTYPIDVISSDVSGIASIVATLNGTSLPLQLANDHYTVTMGGLKAGEYNKIELVATDASPAANKKTQSVYIKYVPVVVDVVKPVLLRVTPAKDSAVINASSMKVTIKATDESGIGSVVASLGSASPTVTSTGSEYSADVANLTASQWNTLRFVATDASTNGNKETLFVTVKYDPTMTDSGAPTFTKASSNPVSGSTVTTAAVSLVYTIADPSGVGTVSWTINGGTATTVSPAGGQYTFAATLRSPPHENSIVITAQDQSSNHNSGTETVTLNYNLAPVATTPPSPLSTPRATPLSITLAATDPETDPITTWTIVSGPFNGTIGATLPTFTYTPNAAFDGRDSLTFTASDGTATSAAAKVQITVTANNVAPTISVLAIAPTPVDKGASVSFSATTNFGAAYPTAVYRLVRSPYTAAADTIASGTVAGTALSYSVAATYAHQASYKMVIRNIAATVETTPVALTVRDVTAPVVTLTGAATISVNQNGSWTDPTATATDDRDGTISPVKTGTLNLAVPGVYTLRYTATDAGGNSSYKERTVTVVAVYNVVYYPNIRTEGSVPPTNSYAQGTTVTVSTNSGNLVRNKFSFNGWNTLANGSGTSYSANGSATFTINSNVSLYAQWKPQGMNRIAAASDANGFQMGQTGFEVPVHTVKFTKDYWMDLTEVTQVDYSNLIDTYYGTGHLPDWSYIGNGYGNNYPAYSVTWDNAILYCNARTKASGSLDTVYEWSGSNPFPSGSLSVTVHFDRSGFRLPTEAEWEYACRAGTSSTYFWGESVAPSIIDSYCWWLNNTSSNYSTVAQKSPNPWGLYDMCGNVYEWVNDFSNEYSPGEQIDPRGPVTSPYVSRVVRGGYIGNDESYFRSAARQSQYQYFGGWSVGFRVCLPAQ